jgi:hypothetical protein
VPQRLLSELRQRRRRQSAPWPGARHRRERFCRPARTAAGRHPSSIQHPHHRRRRHRRRHPWRPAGNGRAPRRQGRLGARHDRPGAEIRRRLLAPADRRPNPPTFTPPASRPAKRMPSSAAIWWSVPAPKRCRKFSPARRKPWSTSPKRQPPSSPATPTGSSRRATCRPRSRRPVAKATRSSSTPHSCPRLIGDAVYGNLFLLGVAWQKDSCRCRWQPSMRPSKLNGTALEENRQAFLWGRRAAHDPHSVQRSPGRPAQQPATTLADARRDDQPPRRRADRLSGRALRQRYRSLVERVRAAETRLQSTP